ncbi:MAG: hypothetical protein KDJ39_15170 [Gammaproteobacteria bacterium]|nr:hypothetical protein [Gammaproteobacteria bacterium]
MLMSVRKFLLVLLAAIAAPAYANLIPPAIGAADYAVLRSALQTRLPDYAPGWTDHNDSDPGVALLTLFAFTAEDLAYRVAGDVPGLVWLGYDPDAQQTRDELAYTLLDAAYLAVFPNDPQAADWLLQQGIDPAWSTPELRAAARRALPLPSTALLLGVGLLLHSVRPRRRTA